MTHGEETAIVAWLLQAERGFRQLAEVLEGIASGRVPLSADEAAHFARVTREFESQAQQLRTGITVQPPTYKM
jgi:hypothetical protein